ncbi:hypothetical protein SERLADRAFT_438980 [Serpula lacrymans var. lacrymans S7.9]|uniref:Uncharacterized protein n=1 Tax=Serpula lacrymans var. lacrymans (strain S7.9) TaxID=578457 RepID=F8NYJ7_SERL9|nr:uncharacterized protein SERLADRAFT_438980 [Serpula lacrymans var. lacrymans S7.9]EGO23668.1 hypothetical protein SERLADRAFT_438980 [Serpula lacrymans var. lacrymans S7.9]
MPGETSGGHLPTITDRINALSSALRNSYTFPCKTHVQCSLLSRSIYASYSKIKHTQLLHHKAQNARKSTLLDSRFKACGSRASLQRHENNLLVLLDATAMSGDETDNEVQGAPKTYLISRPHWQSPEMKDFMRKLDHIYRENWRNPHGRRATAGNAPRIRIASNRCEPGHAPRGLWRNCYDSNWLKDLRGWQRDKLDIVDKDYDFTISDSEL